MHVSLGTDKACILAEGTPTGSVSRLVCGSRLWRLQLRCANKGGVDVLLVDVGAWAGTVCGLRHSSTLSTWVGIDV